MCKRLLFMLLLSFSIMAVALSGCGRHSSSEKPSVSTVLSITNGDVFIMKANTSTWVKAQVGVTLKADDTIKAGNDSWAVITFFEGSTIELEPGTEVSVATLNITPDTGSTTISLKQEVGKTVSRVKKLADPASSYEVSTPTGVAAVRGSVMLVDVAENGTTIVGNGEGSIAVIAQGVEVQIPQGMQSVVAIGQQPSVPEQGLPFVPSGIVDNTISIITSAGVGGSISPSGSVTVSNGADQTFTITPNAHYHIVDVLVDDVSVGAVTSYTFSSASANHIISTTFAIDTYAISTSADTHGSITPANPTVNYGADQAFTIIPDTGYHVADVLVDSVSVGVVSSYTFSSISANYIISATFSINTYIISTSASTHGSITPTNPTVNYGANQAFIITPDSGYHIDTLMVDGSPVTPAESYTFTNVTANHSINATFVISADWYVNPGESIQAAIDASAAAGGGTVHVAAGTYHELITLRSGVVVQGAGVAVTTIDGNGIGTVVTASAVDSTAKLKDLTISHGNDSGMVNYSSSPTVSNCTFLGNSASDGGGMLNFSSSPTVTNCIFLGNSASSGNGGGMGNSYSSPTVTNCIFSDNSASAGGGIENSFSSPVVTNCTFSGNSATEGAGILCRSSSSPTITNCIIDSNSASWSGGGIECDYSSSPTISNCIISHNSANYGGGMQCNESSPVVINCIISHNTSNHGGGGINNDDASSTFINCIIAQNNGPGGGLHSGDTHSSVTAVNCIIWGNTVCEVSVNPTCYLNITYSDVQGGYGGTGNINEDPMFTSDFHLQAGSPCIDMGNNAAVPSGITTDFEGNPRIIDGNGDGTAIVDIGADEY